MNLHECSLTDEQVRWIKGHTYYADDAVGQSLYRLVRRLDVPPAPPVPRQISDYLHEKALVESAQIIADAALRVRMLDTARIGELLSDRTEPNAR